MLDSPRAAPIIAPHTSPVAPLRNLPIVLFGLLTLVARAAEPLTTLPDCKFSPTPWADGDSFEIITPANERRTLRLYGADCLEWHVNDSTDARRLREQRRYFGIAEFGGSPQASNETAMDLGRRAGEETARLLARPFTVHTAGADARGDGRHPRVYAFVTTADGKDLAELLVSAGLARAFGVYRETPQGKPAKEYQASLRDLEILALKAGKGAWAKTNWEKLPAERQQQRNEDAELELAAAPAKPPANFQLDPNTAPRDELMKIPGIGEVTANRIIQARPFRSIQDLLNVEGIGPRTLERYAPYLKLPK